MNPRPPLAVLLSTDGSLSRKYFVVATIAVIALWLLVQVLWWFVWLIAAETCTTLAAMRRPDTIIAEGMWPAFMFGVPTILLTAAFFHLVCMRRRALQLTMKPVHIAARLYVIQMCLHMLSEYFLRAGCPADPKVSPNSHAELLGILFLGWYALAAVSLGLAVYFVVVGLRGGGVVDLAKGAPQT